MQRNFLNKKEKAWYEPVGTFCRQMNQGYIPGQVTLIWGGIGLLEEVVTSWHDRAKVKNLGLTEFMTDLL